MLVDELEGPGPFIIQVPDILSLESCADLVAKIDRLGPERAPVNAPGGERLIPDVRNNERVMFDDPVLAEILFERVRHHVPNAIDGRRLIGANERFRCYRYKPGMRFAPHLDGSFIRDVSERSYYSFLVFLNEGFKGGETRIHTKPMMDIKPKVGLGLLFRHRILHEGVEVRSGVKYVARSDLMYRSEQVA